MYMAVPPQTKKPLDRKLLLLIFCPCHFSSKMAVSSPSCPPTPSSLVSVVSFTHLAISSLPGSYAKQVIGESFLHIPWRSAANLHDSSLWKLKATQETPTKLHQIKCHHSDRL